MKGFLIKDFFAPTSCMVFITKRFEKIDNLIELFINRRAIIIKSKVKNNKPKVIF